jgi:hypothetical protein
MSLSIGINGRGGDTGMATKATYGHSISANISAPCNNRFFALAPRS